VRTLLAVALWLLLAGAALAGTFDCVGSACPPLVIEGDAPSTLPDGRPSPFRGYADPTIRRDPATGRLWMAYSWPALNPQRGRFTPFVETHLAVSDDGGRRWRFHSVLWAPTPARAPDGTAGRLSHEVPALLPVETPGGVLWYGASLEYFIPDGGGFQQRPVQSFRASLRRAESVPGLRDAPAVVLGGAVTDPAWGVDVNLAALAPDLGRCAIWQEHALHYEAGELYLAMVCLAFAGRRPDLAQNAIVVFAARPDGPPRAWTWRYAGRLAGAAEARELGAQRLTQIDLARARDGALLAIMTPDDWSERHDDFVHKGCVAVEVASLSPARLARDEAGKLKVRAVITVSDAGPAGSAACAYDPASATGLVIGKRTKTGASLGGATGAGGQLSVILHRTGVHP
jgi:hypothetical protein